MKIYKFCFHLLCWQQTIFEGIASRDLDNMDIDAFISSYINEVKRTLRLDGNREHTVTKRSHSDIDISQLEGIDVLYGFEELFSLPAKYPNDIVFFSECALNGQNEQGWFAVTLESSLPNPHRSLSNELVLYRYHAGAWTPVYRVGAMGGTRIASERIGDDYFVIVAESEADDTRGSTVLQVDTKSYKLHFVQRLPIHHPSHVIMWKWADMEAFAAVAIGENDLNSARRYSTQSPVYQWRGSHFDQIGTLPTQNPRALAHFNIRNAMFIAVANYQNDFGDTNVDSHIYRYDMSTNKFNLYQLLPTEAAVDIKYFCFEGNHITESFLIYASAYHTDEEGNRDYNTASIIYKLSDKEYFVPFQALHVSKVSSWLPVRYMKEQRENLFLLGATEEGVVTYQYDGWRFAVMATLVDQKSFGPGPRVFTVFYPGQLTLIGIANKLNPGSGANIFAPVVQRKMRIDDVRKTLSSWEKLVSEEVSNLLTKTTSLLQKAQSAPKVDDPTLEMTRVVFDDVQANFVQANLINGIPEYEEIPAVNGLISMKEDLGSLQLQLEGIKNKINDISLNTRNVYEEITVPEANITCPHACEAHDLRPETVNGEDFNRFLANAVPVTESMEFEEVSFKQLALIDPLEARTINGHAAETLVDWSKPVELEHGLRVEGDFIVEGDLIIEPGLTENNVDGVIDELDSSSTNGVNSRNLQIKRLNAAQLVLLDGRISGVDFDDLSQHSLKTEGVQVFTEFTDIQRIRANEVTANRGLFKAGDRVPPSPFHHLPIPKAAPAAGTRQNNTHADIHGTEPPEGSELIKEDEEMDETEDFEQIDSVNLTGDAIEIPGDLEIFGTVTIENGSLLVGDLVDLKNNVSAAELKKFAIPLNETMIDQHFQFNAGFETPNLTVDTVNGIRPEDMAESVPLKGTKQMDITNKIGENRNTGQAKESIITVDSLTIDSLNSKNIKLGEKDWQQVALLEDDGHLFIKRLEVKENANVNSINVRGSINNFHLEKLLNDTVYNDGKIYKVTGQKKFEKSLSLSNLTVGISSEDVETIILKKRLSLAKVFRVDNLVYTGQLDGVEAESFGKWLETEGDQSLLGSTTMERVTAARLVVDAEDRFNLVDLHRLASQGVSLDDDVTLENVRFDAPVTISELEVGGNMNGLKIPEDVVLVQSGTQQNIFADKRIKGNLHVLGTFKSSFLSGRNFTALCDAFSKNSTSLIVLGKASFKSEPGVLKLVNGKNLNELFENVWFKEDDINVKKQIYFDHLHFKSLDVEMINSLYVEDELSQLVSLSEDQTVNGTFYFDSVTLEEDMEGEEALVGGAVQGVRLEPFLKTVLLDGEDQIVWGEPSFGRLIVDGVLDHKGLVNGLNFSEDLVLLLPSNRSIQTLEDLQAGQLAVGQLTAPNGTLVYGVDVEKWNKTAVKKSGRQTVEGNLVIDGAFSSANGISVLGLINGAKFDKKHLLLVKGDQTLTGHVRFSSEAKVKIKKMLVDGLLNEINITEFYNRQIPVEGQVTLTGKKKFSSPIKADRAILPEIYLGHNLTWLDKKLGTPLPLEQYEAQLAAMSELRKLARTSLDGKILYVQNWTRISQIEGPLISLFPLKSENSTYLATIRETGNETSLSLLDWSDKYQRFVELSGMQQVPFKDVPVDVQSVNMQGGDLSVYITRLVRSVDGNVAGFGELLGLQSNGASLIRSKMILFGEPGTTLFSYPGSKGAARCFVLVGKTCRAFCDTASGKRRKFLPFSCNNVTQATLLVTEESVYLLGIENGEENNLVVWKIVERRFTKVLSQPQFNPVAITATLANGPHIALATRHVLGSPQLERVDIYRLNEKNDQLLLEQSLDVIGPKKILFSVLPSNESVLYVASDNPATPLWIFVRRGVIGYQLISVDRTLPTTCDLHAFTDEDRRHFVVLFNKDSSVVLEANFG